MTNEPYANLWLAAASTGYAQSSDWIEWADGIIENSERPPLWVIEMSVARTYSDLREALAGRVEIEDSRSQAYFPFENAQAGYYYLSYCENRMGVIAFLQKVSEIAEAGRSSLSPEAIFKIMNKLEDKDVDDAEKQTVIHSIQEYFGSYGALAVSHWDLLKKGPEGITA